MRLTLAAGALLLLAASPACAAADPARYMPAELITETLRPKPGSTILVGFRMTPKPGWHGYWSNPGDSGIAPSVAWTRPAGVRFGPLLHPAPTLISADGISSFVHEGPHVLLARMTIGRSIAAGTPIPVTAKLSWAACTASQCVPLHGSFTLDLVAGDGDETPDAAVLKGAEAKLPVKAAPGAFTRDGDAVRLRLPSPLKLDPASTRFFPEDNDAFATAAGRPSLDRGAIVLAGPARTPRDSISGVVTDGRRSYEIAFNLSEPDARPRVTPPSSAPAQERPAAVPPRAAPVPSPQPRANPSVEDDWRWLALAIVFVGAIASGFALRRRKRR